MVNKKADMRIQQMTLMILFVFIFFIIAGLFALSISMAGIKGKRADLQRELTISSLETITNMPELNCESKSQCIDEDKLFVMSSLGEQYSTLWPVASIRVRKIYPKFLNEVICPAQNCTTFNIYDSGQSNVQEYGTFVSLCKKVKREGLVQEDCAIARLEVGVIIKE